MNYNLSSFNTVIPDAPTSSRRPFLTPLPTPGHFLLVLDNTALDKIKRCHVAAYNYLVLGREPHAKDAALVFGGAVHEGLELFHKMQWEEQCGAESVYPEDWKQQSNARQDQAVLSYFTSHPAPPDEYRTPTVALEVLRHYRHRANELLYPDYEWEILADGDGPIIERSFELPLGTIEVNAWIDADYGVSKDSELTRIDGLGNVTQTYISTIQLCWSGRIDLGARVNGRSRIVDNKTSKISGDQFVQSFQLASQTIGYLWAGRQLWPDLDFSGFCLNAIILKKPSAGVGLTDRGPRGGEPALSFFRSYFDYAPEFIDAWQEDTLCHIEDFLHAIVRGHRAKNDKQCFDKYGQCSYHSVCTTEGAAVRDAMLRSDAFRTVTWNPTAH